jgi:hypothetical protein
LAGYEVDFPVSAHDALSEVIYFIDTGTEVWLRAAIQLQQSVGESLSPGIKNIEMAAKRVCMI